MIASANEKQIMRASAGTGKTFQLSNRFLGLLTSDVECPTILATTFTRKAAGEILDRIIFRLAEAAIDSDAASELAKFVGDATVDSEKCKSILTEVMQELHRVQIGTLDSYFSRLARSFSLELGFPADWRIINESNFEQMMLRDEAIEAVLNEGKAKELVHLLTKGDATRGVSSLIRRAVNSLYSLFLDSPKEAWYRVQRPKMLNEEQIYDLLSQLEAVEYPTPGMKKKVDVDIEKFALEKYTDFIKAGLANKVRKGESIFNRKEIPAEAIAIYKELLAHARNVQLKIIADQTEANYKVLELYHDAFQRLKAERRTVQYDDITRGLGDLVEKINLKYVGFRMDRRVNHLLLDEFQDTSPQQWRVIRPFAKRVCSHEATEEFSSAVEPHRLEDARSFFCVGDIKQAIYRWRGGEAGIFDRVAEEFSAVEEATPLVKSYRSSQIVIDTVNQLFKNMSSHPGLENYQPFVESWCDRFLEHSTAKDKLAGYATVESAESAEMTFDYAADKVLTLTEQAPDKTIGVLVRKNDAVRKMIYTLGKKGIVASEEGGNPLTDSAAVQVVISVLRLADHPGDKISWFHALHSPLANLLSLVDEDGKPLRYDAGHIAEVAFAIRKQLLTKGYGKVMQEWAAELKPACNRRETDRVNQLLDLAFNVEKQTTLRPTDFVKLIESQRVSDPSASKVRVMNIHQAKGLEFDAVILPELSQYLITMTPTCVYKRESPGKPIETVCRYVNAYNQSLLPDNLRGLFDHYQEQEIQDQLCLLYVAMTRARQALHIILEPKVNERSFPKTVAGLVRAGLTDHSPVEPCEMLYEAGDPRWFEKQGDEPEKDDNDDAGENAGQKSEEYIKSYPAMAWNKPIRLADSAPTVRRGLETLSPSKVEGGKQINVMDILESKSNIAAMQRGELIHRFFKELQWLEISKPNFATLQEIAKDFLDLQVDLTQVVDDFHMMLKRDALLSLLSENDQIETTSLTYDVGEDLKTQVLNERRFAIRIDNNILQGSIDRLVLFSNSENEIVAADIVDFKTDHIDQWNLFSVRDKIEYYRPQLNAYKQAVSKLYGIPDHRITTKLVFCRYGQVEHV